LLEVADNITQGPSPFDGVRTYHATADVGEHELPGGTVVTYGERPSRANLVATSGDLLFAKMQSTAKVLQVNSETSDAIFSTGFFNLRPRRGKIESRYLYWFLRSPIFQNAKDRRCTGATQKALTLAGLREIEIPLPDSLDHQRRISALLDKAFEVQRKRVQTREMADELLQSAFLDRFGDPLTNKKGLPTAPINELGRVVTGNTPPRANPENYGNAIEWIKSDNINTPEHFLTPADEYLSEVGKLQGRTVPAGSTLVTCIAGSPSVIGNAALADREVAFNQQINAVVPD
jgi:type I restriction enzyme S subunit